MKFRILIIILALISFTLDAQRKKKSSDDEAKSAFEELSISGLKFRSIGPALTSGRISDFAVNPVNPKEYYVLYHPEVFGRLPMRVLLMIPSLIVREVIPLVV